MNGILRTNSQNLDFIALVTELDQYLATTDGSEHSFYSQYNQLDEIKEAVLWYEAGKVIGCGAIKPYDAQTVEVKRMYTAPECWGKGIASHLLSELEKWASELGYTRCILETGKRQPEAISLYKKCGYALISNYGQYAGVDNSLCFDKILKT
ncbi:GNAT family N-acetyltransferase [Reichenbachiella sp. 5M10]|uniref:GNAT family N-acetyltransferase n=1 Tax=Reichenbachiella sp. 5M10 TaxID=1889772 RepID=UPI000C14E2EA|nr:GNAT family N-acetyltransferase [Reichenbachiella sp. 5M10]PIB35854.1 GNAT family N-acetyltransferase [Reichenbachiella sp. 5M10]